MYLFAGMCPYGILIAGHSPSSGRIIAIGINSIAYNYMVKNIRLNRVEGRIIPVLGNIRKGYGNWIRMCDGVLMSREAREFLNEAFSCLK